MSQVRIPPAAALSANPPQHHESTPAPHDGAVPRTSTYALTNATLPYVGALADMGWRNAVSALPVLAAGLSTHDGDLLSSEVAQAHGYTSTLLD